MEDGLICAICLFSTQTNHAGEAVPPFPLPLLPIGAAHNSSNVLSGRSEERILRDGRSKDLIYGQGYFRLSRKLPRKLPANKTPGISIQK
jgi:hypothetical protein